MKEFHVEDMTCGHCVSAITKAVKDLDPQASVDIDLKSHLVRVESGCATQAIQDAISAAGYTVR